MGGRGSSGGGRGGGGGSAAYKSAYAEEISDSHNFAASFAVDPQMSKSAIGYEMYVHQSATGRSLIAETRSEITSLKEYAREVPQIAKQQNAFYKSEVMSKDYVKGTVAAIKEKISIREKAVTVMESARTEYEKYKRQAAVGNAKAKRRGGKWM